MATARVPEPVANECLALIFQMQIKTRSGNPISQCTRWCAASLFIKLARRLDTIEAECADSPERILNASTVLQPDRSDFLFLTLVLLWVGSKMFEIQQISLTELKACSSRIISDKVYTAKDFVKAVSYDRCMLSPGIITLFLIALILISGDRAAGGKDLSLLISGSLSSLTRHGCIEQTINFEIETGRSCPSVLEDLLRELRRVSRVGDFIKLSTCFTIYTLMHSDSFLRQHLSRAALPASIIVVAYLISVPKKQALFPVLQWVCAMNNQDQDEIQGLTRLILQAILE
ncbi:unnamed protein product [Closterium sp. Yama58-4]|nr:unnamed protein product [Closterium sp. Yama58-4]